MEIAPGVCDLVKDLLDTLKAMKKNNFAYIREVDNIFSFALDNMAIRHKKNPDGFEFKILAKDIPEYDPNAGVLLKPSDDIANDNANVQHTVTGNVIKFEQ